MRQLKYVFLSLWMGAFLLSCGEDEVETPVMPSELSFELTQDAENPAAVQLSIASQNANFYRVFFGDEGGTVPMATKEETLNHTYTSTGNYTIRVQAHATEALFISESKTISIDLGDGGDNGGNNGGGSVNIPSEGYSTPETYEGLQLVWQDEFEGTQLNADNWSFETGNGSNGWGNNELQYYRRENTQLQEGHLVITAKKENYQGAQYTSSRIVTKGKQEFQYGRIDIRAALPKGQGIWPALWMLGSNFSTAGWPACGEIDIMEMVGGGAGRDNVVHGTVHWAHEGAHAEYGKSYTLQDGLFADEFHVFSIVWDENSISWYVDDVEFNRIDTTPAELSEFHQKFFFIFNLAVGGNWPGNPDNSTVFPQHLIVDYVRVFQPQ